MITDQELDARLARRTTVPTSPLRPLADIHTRARAIRRAQRARRAGALTVLAGGFGVGLVAVRGLPVDDGRSRSVTPAVPASSPTSSPTASPAPDCNGGFADMKTFEDIPELLYLPSPTAAGQPVLKPALAREDRSNCKPAPVQGNWYAITSGVVTRSLQVTGPGARDPYDGPGAWIGGSTETVTVRGDRKGTLRQDANTVTPRAMLFWHEPDGSSWWADGPGMDRRQFLAAVEALKISRGHLTPGPVPGMDVVAALPRTSQPRQVMRYFSASFGHQNEDQGGWSLWVREGAATFVPLPGSHQVDVNGRTAWWYPGSPARSRGDLVWADGQDLLFSVTGTINQAKALAVARSTTKVRPDDPRLLAAREDPAAASSPPVPGRTPTAGAGPAPTGPGAGITVTAGATPTSGTAGATPPNTTVEATIP